MVSAFLNPFAARAGTDQPPLQAAPDGRPLTLVFFDDFQIFRPWTGNDGIWRATLGDGSLFSRDRGSRGSDDGIGEIFDSVLGGLDPFSIDPVAVDEGVLEITAQPTPRHFGAGVENYPYVSGLISTQPSFSQTYGYFEMRAELPQGKGLWPAFWMLPKDDSWPPEIDVVESIGDPSHVYMTAHSKHGKSDGAEAYITPNAFHTFAVSWDRRDLVWYIDGGEAAREATPDDMHKPMYMLANLAVGGNWPGSPDASTHFPAKLMIDYIRAYRFEI
ncbi:MAG TPA: glycoside hydrolase family 16 protein [Stellaceae bacterium]|nr:glycoside hydrolase family 16 protein [Stellaceae bacterium]